jgi:acyl transferase domain-containing protein
MHLALSAIKLGEIDQALVIGAYTSIHEMDTVNGDYLQAGVSWLILCTT